MPIKLKNFTRYDIYPDGTVKDTKTGKNVIFNRHLNFVMHTDDGNPPLVLENIRDLITSLVKQGVSGFVEELPPYKPPDFFAPLKQRFDAEVGEVKSEELHKLREAVKLASSSVLKPDISDSELVRAKEWYQAKNSELELFKQNNPLYFKWPPFTPKIDEEFINKLKEEEAELIAYRIELTSAIDRLRMRYKNNPYKI